MKIKRVVARLQETAYFSDDSEYTIIIQGAIWNDKFKKFATDNGVSVKEMQEYLTEDIKDMKEEGLYKPNILFASGLQTSATLLGSLKKVKKTMVYFRIGGEEGDRWYNHPIDVYQAKNGVLVCKSNDVN
jgi:hypothetical protein